MSVTFYQFTASLLYKSQNFFIRIMFYEGGGRNERKEQTERVGVREWKFEREQRNSYSNINTSPPRDSEDSARYITHSGPALTGFMNLHWLLHEFCLRPLRSTHNIIGCYMVCFLPIQISVSKKQCHWLTVCTISSWSRSSAEKTSATAVTSPWRICCMPPAPSR